VDSTGQLSQAKTDEDVRIARRQNRTRVVQESFDHLPSYLGIATSSILIMNCYLPEIRRIGRDYTPHRLA